MDWYYISHPGWRRNIPLQVLHGSEFSLHQRNEVKILTEAFLLCMSQTRLCSITGTPLTNILPPHQILTGQNITISVLSHILLQFTSFCTVWFSFVSFQGLKYLMSEEPVKQKPQFSINSLTHTHFSQH